MSHLVLFTRPYPPTYPPLGLVGTMAPYNRGEDHETRLDIINQIGDCTVQILSATNLPPGAIVWVDNPNKQVVIQWPGYSPPETSIPVFNGDFEAGNDGSWIVPAFSNPWGIGSDFGETGYGARFQDATGRNVFRATTLLPVLETYAFELSARIDPGLSGIGNVQAAVGVWFYDTDYNFVAQYLGNVVVSSGSSSWQDSILNFIAPADGFVQPIIEGKRFADNEPLYVDNVEWDFVGYKGSLTPDLVTLELRITDSMHRTADWTGSVSAILIIDHDVPILWAGNHLYSDTPDNLVPMSNSAITLQNGGSQGVKEVVGANDGSVVALRYQEDASNDYYFYRWDSGSKTYSASPITGYQSIGNAHILHAVHPTGDWIITVHLGLAADELRLYTYEFDGTGYTYRDTFSYTSIYDPRALIFSPDATKIAAFHQEAGAALKVWSLAIDGSLTLDYSVSSGMSSPTCDWLGNFILGCDGNSGLVRVLNASNGSVKGSTTHGTNHYGAYFSDDGLWIYSLQGNSNVSVYSFDPGTGAIAHDNTIALGFDAANISISADRKYLYFAPDTGTTDNALFECNGGVLTRLADLPYATDAMVWTNLPNLI